MKGSDEDRHKKAISIKQAKRTMLDVTKMSASSDDLAVPKAAVTEWSESMSRGRETVQILWNAYLSEDHEIFDAALKRMEPSPLEIRLLLDYAHHEPSPEASSKLGVASARRHAPVKAAIRKDWASAQAQGSKKSKSQFVRDWRHKQVWSSNWVELAEATLYDYLPSSKSKK